MTKLYPEPEGPSGCIADFTAAMAGLETVTASSVTGAWPEPGLTVASLLVCSVCKTEKQHALYRKKIV